MSHPPRGRLGPAPGSVAAFLLCAGLLAGCPTVVDDDDDDDGPSLEDGERAAGLRLTHLEVNQGVGVTLVDGDGALVDDPAAALVLTGRDAVVRAGWELGPDFTPRRIEARVVLADADGEPTDTWSQELEIVGPSDLRSLDAHVHVRIPGDRIFPDSQLALGLYEVDSDDGDLDDDEGTPDDRARLPASGFAPLRADPTPRKLHLVAVPVVTDCGAGPLLSGETLEDTRAYMFNVWPVQELVLTVREQPLMMTGCPTWVGDAMGPLADLRVSDGADPWVYYQGVFSLEGSTDGSGGFGWVLDQALPGDERISVITDWRGSGRPGDIMAHELGHNHGRSHTFDDPGFPGDGQLGERFAWGWGLQDAPLPPAWMGVMGRPLPPADFHDFMSYSYEYWTTAYTWNAAAERIAAVTAWEEDDGVGARDASAAPRLLASPKADGSLRLSLRGADDNMTVLFAWPGRHIAALPEPTLLVRAADGTVARALPLQTLPGSERTPGLPPALRGALPSLQDGERLEVHVDGRVWVAPVEVIE